MPYGLEKCSAEVHAWNDALRAFTLALGDDIQECTVPQYRAYKRPKTFAYFQFRPTKNSLVIEVPRSPHDPIPAEPGLVEKRSNHLLGVIVDRDADVSRAQEFIRAAHERG